MVRKFLLILLVIISNNASAFIQDQTLICDKDSRGYIFITENKVQVLSINYDELNIISISHSYELTENVIFIQQPFSVQKKENINKPIGWIFRRNLDYVSLEYVNGDWSRKFSWRCEVLLSSHLKTRLKNTLVKLINAIEKKF